MLSKIPASASTSTSVPRRSTVPASSNVRRTLFHHNARNPSTSTSTSTTTLQETLQDSSQDDSFEIVVKDSDGNYDVFIPFLPPLDDEQAREDDTTEKESRWTNSIDDRWNFTEVTNRGRGEIARDVQEQESTAWWTSRWVISLMLSWLAEVDMYQNY